MQEYKTKDFTLLKVWDDTWFLSLINEQNIKYNVSFKVNSNKYNCIAQTRKGIPLKKLKQTFVCYNLQLFWTFLKLQSQLKR
jgi:hypothetical protein